MYAQPSRIIEEILQNTEDAYARKGIAGPENIVRFKLFNDRLEIHHNGKDFDEADLMSITTFANTTKKSNSGINQIGKFGIGFKSVFSITDTPEIHCHPYHYAIRDFEVLDEVNPRHADEKFNTLIILPFKKKNPENCYNSICSELSAINEYLLLFLKKTDSIEVYVSGALLIQLSRELMKVGKISRIVSIKKTTHGRDTVESLSQFLIYSKIPLPDKQQPELAFRFEEVEGIMKIIPVPDSPVFVYFPTKMNSRLNFIINAPFTTNPLREYIPLDENLAPENIKLLKESTALFTAALKDFKQNKILDLYFLNQLTIINQQKNDIGGIYEAEVYGIFYDALSAFLKKGASIPVINGLYGCWQEVLLPQDAEIAGLLSSGDLQKLFQKRFFIDPEINDQKFYGLRNYFNDVLNIKTADAQSFGFRLLLDIDFLKTKNIGWLQKFYSYLYKNQVLWDVRHSAEYYSLRKAAIILTSDGQFRPAFSAENTLKVFLPPSEKCYLPVIHKKLLDDSGCMAFFNDFGITAPEPADDVEFNIMPRFDHASAITVKEYSKYLEKILFVYGSASEHKRQRLIELLRVKPWVYCIKPDEPDNRFFKKPDEAYLYSLNLSDYFENYQVYFADPVLFKKFNKKYPAVFSLLLKEAGVKRFPRLFGDETNHPGIEGFDGFLSGINIKNSLAFIRLLLTDASETPDHLTKFLYNKKWIFSRNNTFESPENMRRSDISGLYKLSVTEIGKLCNLLGIGEKNNEAGYSLTDWYPLIKPEEAISKHRELSSDIRQSQSLNLSNSGILLQGSFLFPEAIKDERIYSPDSLEKIHLWSCKYFEHIIKEGDEYKGCEIESSDIFDYVVKKNGLVQEYILICGKTDLMNNFVLTSRQLTGIFKMKSNSMNIVLFLLYSAGTQYVHFKKVHDPFKQISNEMMVFKDKIWFSVLF